jgi:hypothetical protein
MVLLCQFVEQQALWSWVPRAESLTSRLPWYTPQKETKPKALLKIQSCQFRCDNYF